MLQAFQPHLCLWLCLGHLHLSLTSSASPGFLSNPWPHLTWAFTSLDGLASGLLAGLLFLSSSAVRPWGLPSPAAPCPAAMAGMLWGRQTLVWVLKQDSSLLLGWTPLVLGQIPAFLEMLCLRLGAPEGWLKGPRLQSPVPAHPACWEGSWWASGYWGQIQDKSLGGGCVGSRLRTRLSGPGPSSLLIPKLGKQHSCPPKGVHEDS